MAIDRATPGTTGVKHEGATELMNAMSYIDLDRG
jgi:hypothetical protein